MKHSLSFSFTGQNGNSSLQFVAHWGNRTKINYPMKLRSSGRTSADTLVVAEHVPGKSTRRTYHPIQSTRKIVQHVLNVNPTLQFRHCDLSAQLISNGASPWDTNNVMSGAGWRLGDTPLHTAVMANSFTAVHQLLVADGRLATAPNNVSSQLTSGTTITFLLTFLVIVFS